MASTALPQPPVFDEKLSEFDSVPLFMRSLPEDGTDDVALSALQSLVHDGTSDEVAENFKDQGNDYFKGKRYRDALGFYTQGIDAKPTNAKLLDALLCNRAACNLELKNYGSALRDCAKALTVNIESSKAYYRSAMALLALDRPAEAIDACDRCLAYDSQNAGVRSAREKAVRANDARLKREKEQEERLRKERQKKQKLRLAYKQRNLFVVKNPSGSDNPYDPHFDPDDTSESTLVIPAFFLYPQYATSDLISHFSEDTTFGEQIAAAFPEDQPPPEWDINKQYEASKLVVYAITRKKRLLKVGKKMTLKGVCTSSRGKEEEVDGLELKDGCLSFVILPKGAEEQKWVENFKSTR